MVKKELVNKKVVRAIALGLSAVMLTTPMTALAASGDAVDPDTDTTDAEVKQDEVVADAINDAQDTISNSEEGNNVVVDTNEVEVVLPSTVTDENPDGDKITLVPDAVEAAGNDDLSDVKTTVGEGEKAKEITYETVIGEATEDNNTGLLGANAELEDAEDALSDVVEAEANAKQDIAETNTIIDEIKANNTAVTDANTKAQAAADKAEEALAEAQAATTEAAAQAAVDKAEEAFNEATAAQADAQAAYDANVEKLAAAEAELLNAEMSLKKAKECAETTVEELAAAHAAVSEAAANAEALKAQVDADAEALAGSKEAALKAAYDAMKTAGKVGHVYVDDDATDANGDGISDEWSTSFDNESAPGAYWTAAREYFKLYVQYVYGDTFVSGVFENKNTLGNGWTYKASRDNTYTVIYNVTDEEGNVVIGEDGNPVTATAYYNYHTADKDGNIYIYEKEIATGMTEEVWGKTTETFEDTRLVDKTRIEQQEKSETTSEDVLSIDNGDGTYTKLSEVQQEGDIVLPTEEAEDGTATSVLVKDANSQLLDSNEVGLADNQTVISSEDSYSIGTILVPASYGTKEEKRVWSDKISTVEELKAKCNYFAQNYSEEDGYKIRIYVDHWYAPMEEITLDSAGDIDNQLEAFLFGWVDKGYEIGVFQTVEDTENVTEWAEQKVIIKTTTATVETTTSTTTMVDKIVTSGEYKNRGGAESALNAFLKENGLQHKDCRYSIVGNKRDGFRYIVSYKVPETTTTTSTEQKVVKTEKYSATEYNTNTITTTRTWMEDVVVNYQEEETFTNTREVDVLLEESKEYQYWTERRNTSNDSTIKDAMAGYMEAAKIMKAKQDAAAVALAAALQAQADVEKAQAEFDELELEVNDSACVEAAEKLALAKVAYDQATKDLEAATQAAEDAKDAYEDAAKELDRFIPASSTGGEGGTTGGGAGTTGGTTGGTTITTTTVPTTETLVADADVAPTTVAATAGAGQAVVEIEDEDTPLAAGIDNGDADANGGDDEVIVAEAEDDAEQAIVAIEDEETPLAAGADADAKMSWWWLLIVALLGATGYKMYKDHQKKKEEAQEA